MKAKPKETGHWGKLSTYSRRAFHDTREKGLNGPFFIARAILNIGTEFEG
jgi:hypothetical protein